ncbi:transmembrane protein, putative (macronuclear) [Tetrahymena thermophila SB210]|uniref:Transmembrane protein, putative n=1 Tax=Tetrahymena thermophila (strain SB210) TaxID=312017 RepID=Q23MA5_TETTS|nr:transmembrane protein, putative [Tetrahymena thermophila SB210]EAR97734.2 transmembrane protein, putative [Tetrahymena thermophila SB210]|eukprot:XP_001017979.2 transmembrane protein, putative [Tetrahymena thermophila SB210]
MNHVITELKIDGVLKILDHANIHIKFEQLVFGKNGILQIGNTSPILNHYVILEEIGDKICSDNQNTQGIFIIQSANYEYNHLTAPVYQGSSTIRQSQFSSHLYISQEVFIVNTSNLISENHTVKSINQKDIQFYEQIQNDFIDDPSKYQFYIKHQRIIIYHKRNLGVFFKNMCILGKESLFKGVAFIDIKAINLQDSTFTHNIVYDQEKLLKQNQSKRSISLHNISVMNIFAQTKDLVIQISEKSSSFQNNLFFSNTCLELKLESSLSQNLFINSNIKLTFQIPLQIELQDVQLHNSLMTFNEENQIQIIQIENSIFAQMNNIKIPTKTKVLKIKNSQFEQVVIDTSQCIDIMLLYLSENTFLCNGIVKSPILVPSLQSRILNQKFGSSSFLSKNTFIGYTHSVMSQPDFLDKYVEKQNPQSSETEAFAFLLEANNFIADKSTFLENENFYLNQKKPIFNVESIQVNLNIVDTKQLFYIEEYNQRNEFLQIQQINYLNSGYHLDYNPFYLQVINVQFAQEVQPVYKMYISNNEDYIFEASDSKMQIIRYKYNTISFRSAEDKNVIYDVQNLQLQITSLKQNRKSNRYRFFIQNLSQAIKKITATILNNSNEKTISFVEGSKSFSKKGISLNRFPNQNLISIEWKQLNTLTQLEISFELCDIGQFLNLSTNECVQSCSDNQNKLGFVCKNKFQNTYSFYLEQLNGGQNQYIQCGYGCKVCENKQSCLECYETFKVDSGKCVDTCNQNEFYSNNQCQQCFEGCQNCDSQDNCNVLQSHKIDSVGKKCTDGEISFQGNCQKCSTECQTCVGQSFFDCTSCSENYSLFKNLCIKAVDNVLSRNELCQPGYGYEGTSNKCIKCQENCLECETQTIVRGSKGMVCNTCTQQSYQNGEILFMKCDKCPPGHFNRLNKCEECDNSCDQEKGCFGPSSFQCNKCKAGYFKHSSTNECLSCSESCLECEQNKDKCTSCPQINPILHNNICLEECPSGFFSIKVNDILNCLECDKSICKECKDQKAFCTKCADYSKILFEGECYDECKQGFFQDASGGCSPCDQYRCKNCVQTPYKCTSCNNNEFLIDHNCYQKCPQEGYFIDKSADDLQCRKCPDTCRICQNSDENPKDIICIQCELALVLVKGQCEAKCPKGFYETYLDNIIQCQKCINNCSQCLEKEDFCIQCLNGYFLFQNKCLSSCPAGYFQDTSKNQCINCIDKNCESCSNHIFYCSKCQNGFFLQQGQCIQTCSVGFYSTNLNGVLKCLKCDKECEECKDGPSNCTKCEKSSYVFEQNQCLLSCPLNTYPDIQRICQPCRQECTKGCVGPDLEDCLEQIQIILQKNNDALYVAIFFPICIIIAITCIYIYRLFKKKQQQADNNNTQEKYKRQSTDVLTLVQLENVESIKPS